MALTLPNKGVDTFLKTHRSMRDLMTMKAAPATQNFSDAVTKVKNYNSGDIQELQ